MCIYVDVASSFILVNLKHFSCLCGLCTAGPTYYQVSHSDVSS